MAGLPDIRSLTFAQLEAALTGLGWERYRARQVFAWLWQKGADGFDAMTNLGKEKRAQLAAAYGAGLPEAAESRTASDGTAKLSLRLTDGQVVESVHIPDRDRHTVCVSTQAGCPLGCLFCATGATGFRRNLAWHEICQQVLVVRRVLGVRPTNVVFMGMGEPFLNYDAVVDALKVLNDDEALGIGARHLTVSTAGIPARIREYAQLPLQARLAVSLNAADDETRSALMPVNRQHPLSELMTAVLDFIRTKDKRVTFEYVMVAGLNDRDRDADNLIKLLSGLLCKVNLIPLNPHPGLELQAPAAPVVRRFAERLYPRLPAVTIRASHGASILAGCGQLGGPRA